MAINSLLGALNILPKKTVDAAPTMPGTDPNLAALRSVAQGDLKSVLTGGDRLMALSALLGSVARGSRTTPQEAMAQVQQNAMNRVSTQMQLAQLEAKAQRDAALAAGQKALISALPKKFQDLAAGMDQEKLTSWLSNLRMQPTYKRVQEDGKWKTKVIYMQSGLEEDAPFELPGNLEKGYLGGKAVWFDKDTGSPFIDPTTGRPAEAGDPMTPKDRAQLAQGEQRIAIALRNANRPRGGSSGGDDLLPEPKKMMIDGKEVMVQWDKRRQRYVPYGAQNVAKPASGFRPVVPVVPGKPLFPNR